MIQHKRASADERTGALLEYKAILCDLLNSRPSGTRQRLATALGKNRSFISQIASQQYSTPIPASHLDVIFDICHFPPAQREQFLAAYARAHPAWQTRARGAAKLRRHRNLPDLGSPELNAKVGDLVEDFVHKLIKTISDHRQKR